jgi:hypothetical protein
MYGARYAEQFIEGGAEKRRNSSSRQETRVLARPTDRTPDTRYVRGEIRYMKIQNPGSA